MKLPAGSRISIIGLGASGTAAALLLKRCGYDVFASELNTSDDILLRAEELKAAGIRVELGKHSQDTIGQSGLVVTCPGVRRDAGILGLAAGAGIPVIDEIELAYRFCRTKNIIAVTGSAGKSTVATLMHRILKAGGLPSHLCGNIGNPFAGIADGLAEKDYVVIEVSSFQLSRTERFHPRIVVFLNLNPNHLDWHRDLDEYYSMKFRVFQNQTKEDFAVLNGDDPLLIKRLSQIPSRVSLFHAEQGRDENASAVSTAAPLLEIPQAVVEEVLDSFKGLEHRFERVAVINGVTFINDSKATTSASTAKALRSIEGNVILIAGGRDKGCDYAQIRDLAARKIRLLIAIGEARQRIRAVLSGSCPIEFAETLEDAVRQAYTAAKGGSTVLLSPMCSSFDMFRNFEQRGEVFKELVKKIASAASAPEVAR